MHVLVATDGQLNPELVVRYAPPLAGSDGTITVLTVVEIPRRLIEEIRSLYGERPPTVVDRDAEGAGTGYLAGSEPFHWPGDDAVLERYLHDKKEERTGPIVRALGDAGVAVDAEAVEGEEATPAIVEYIRDNGVDVVLVGSHGRGLFQGFLGSTGTKLTRMSPCPVMVLRSTST